MLRVSSSSSVVCPDAEQRTRPQWDVVGIRMNSGTDLRAVICKARCRADSHVTSHRKLQRMSHCANRWMSAMIGRGLGGGEAQRCSADVSVPVTQFIQRRHGVGKCAKIRWSSVILSAALRRQIIYLLWKSVPSNPSILRLNVTTDLFTMMMGHLLFSCFAFLLAPKENFWFWIRGWRGRDWLWS